MSTVRIQVRRGLASEWTSANPVLAAGEMGVETNTNLFKFGNGTSTWTALAYANNSDVAIGEISQDAINNALTLGAGLTKTYNDGANTITITVDTDVVSTKTFAISEASAAQAAAIAAAAIDATSKAGAAQSAAIAAAATDASTKANDALLAAEDYTDTAVNSINNSLSGYLEVGERGAAGGVASLDSNSKILQSELPLGSFTADIATTGNLSANNVTVTGNLAVNGTMTAINTENFAIEDTLLLMANTNQSGMLDLGFVAGHNTGVFNHTGFVRDASEDKWKLFKDVIDEPTTTVNFAQGSLDALQVGRFESSEAVINNTTLTGTLSLPNSSILSQNIADEAVLVNHIADSSISAAKIADDAVTTDKIIDNAVVTEKIANDAITTAKILDSNVTEGKINNAAVTENKIASSAVTESKIADSSVTTSKINDESITSAKIVSSAITADKIANGAVTSGKIEDGSILSGHLSNSSVTSDKIQNDAVTSGKIANGTIVDADINASAAIATSKIAGLDSALDSKLASDTAASTYAPIDSPTFTGTVVLPSTTTIGNLTSTELGYLDGITSSVQTQINDAGTALSDHAGDSTNVHGIADTSLLATTANVATAKSEAIAAASTDATTKSDAAQAAAVTAAAAASATAISSHSSDTTDVHGIADTSKLVKTDSASTTLDGALIVEGNLTVNGTTFNASATSITIEDNMLQLAHQNSGNTVDLGLVVGYNDGATKHSGLVRDVSADEWKLFKGVSTEPTTTVDFTQGSLDDLELNNLVAAGIVFSDKTQTKAGVPSLTTIATERSSNTTLDALGTDAAVRDSLVPLAGAVNISFEATGNAKYAIGSSISFYQASGTGANITGSGVTILATPGATLRTTASSVTATKVAATTWLLAGDLKA